MSDVQHQKQARQPFWAQACIVLFLVAVCCAMTACGKKAGTLDPPPGVDKSTFLHVYPNTSLDPAPTYDPHH